MHTRSSRLVCRTCECGHKINHHLKCSYLRSFIMLWYKLFCQCFFLFCSSLLSLCVCLELLFSICLVLMSWIGCKWRERVAGWYWIICKFTGDLSRSTDLCASQRVGMPSRTDQPGGQTIIFIQGGRAHRFDLNHTLSRSQEPPQGKA